MVTTEGEQGVDGARVAWSLPGLHRDARLHHKTASKFYLKSWPSYMLRSEAAFGTAAHVRKGSGSKDITQESIDVGVRQAVPILDWPSFASPMLVHMLCRWSFMLYRSGGLESQQDRDACADILRAVLGVLDGLASFQLHFWLGDVTFMAKQLFAWQGAMRSC